MHVDTLVYVNYSLLSTMQQAIGYDKLPSSYTSITLIDVNSVYVFIKYLLRFCRFLSYAHWYC